MNNELIEKILEDIYLIDADLKKNEKQLRKIIIELVASKPDIKFDEKFSATLRNEILAKIQNLEEIEANKKSFIINLFNFNSMKKAYYVGGGFLTVALLLTLVYTVYPRTGNELALEKKSIDLKSKISRVENNAFGQFSSVSGASRVDSQSISEEISRDSVRTFGVVGSVESAPLGLGGGGMTSDAKMVPGIIMPEYVKYNYIYEGDEFEIPASGDVYKKINKEGVGREMAMRLGGDLGIFDLGKFQNNILTTFNISEDREFGYSIYFDLINNNISINQNWEKWPQLGADCRDDACYKSIQMKIENMPADEEIISIADQALVYYGVDVSSFGKPKINNSWRQSYDLAQDKENAYVPEAVSVVYPLMLDNKEVSDDYGNYIGITVDVNVRYKKMSGIQGVALNDFQASVYNLETDKERIMKFAEQGGLWSGYMPYGNPKETSITLGTPSMGLVSNWKYNAETGRGEDFYVPALIFPITSKSEDVYYNRKTVSVPLLKEILDQAEANDGGIHPRPLLEASSAEGTTSSDAGSAEPISAPAPMVKTIQ